MISFYPGPSKVYEDIPRYVMEAHDQGVLSINHRSSAFIEISKTTIQLLKQKLDIPEDYTIFYVSSATECWEIVTQSLIKKHSTHFFNGAFGEKWYSYSKRIQPDANAQPFAIEEQLTPVTTSADVICLTQNETSNGSEVNNKIIAEFKSVNPQAIIAVDATSSMAGVRLDFNGADVWFASVQKCFGLPAGMAIMVCSPKAIKRGSELSNNMYYNSLSFMAEKMKDYQTTHTPNVLAIYLLMRTLENRKSISEIASETSNRFSNWVTFLSAHKTLNLLIQNEQVRSKTVLPILTAEDAINDIKERANQLGFLLGNGYGKWKNNTFRIANFPAITHTEINLLQQFLNAL